MNVFITTNLNNIVSKNIFHDQPELTHTLDIGLYKKKDMDHKNNQSTAQRKCDRGMTYQLGVELPVNNPREEEHIRHCTQCQAVWPAFYSQQFIDYGYSLTQISQDWCCIPEHLRIRMHPKLIKWQTKLFKSTKIKLTGRHIFFQMNYHRFYDETTGYRERLVLCNGDFASLPPDQKAYFDTLGRINSNDTWMKSSTTPLYLKRQFRLYKDSIYKCPLKKPRGAYHEFIKEYQRDRPELADANPITLAKMCVEPYKQLPPHQIEFYKNQYKVNMEEYKKQDLIERFKFQNKRKQDYFTSKVTFEEAEGAEGAEEYMEVEGADEDDDEEVGE